MEIKTPMVFKLFLANNTILSCFFCFILIMDLYFLVPAVNPQISNPNAELLMTIRNPTKEAKAEIETNPVTIEAKMFNII